MAERRRNPIVKDEWVIIAPERFNRPYQFERSLPINLPEGCPFCPGNETSTPSETLSFRFPGSKKDDSSWWVRFVPNSFPVVKQERNGHRKDSLFESSSAYGVHEVGITRLHEIDFGQPGFDEQFNLTRELLWAVGQRKSELHKEDPELAYALFFKNRGRDAGGSLYHPHIQLLALDTIPKRIISELEATKNHSIKTNRCLLCDIIRGEIEDGTRIVTENKDYVVFEPFASRFPYETWILPKKHQRDFSLNPESATTLASVVRETFSRLNKHLNNPDYNFYIQDAPLNGVSLLPPHVRDNSYHWRIEISPRLIKFGGWEYATSQIINPTSPEKSAEKLREVKV